MANGIVTWRRNCYGKVRCSIAPMPAHRDRVPRISQMPRNLRDWWTRSTKHERICKEVELHDNPRSALDSSCKFQDGYSCNTGWGKLAKRHIFTRRGAETIQEVLWIAKQKYDNQGIFCTGTVPAVGGISSWAVMAWSSWIVNRVRQKLRDCFQTSYTVVNVWENTKRGKPHMHLAVISNDHLALLEVLVNWHDWWFSILRDLTRETGVNLFERFTDGSCRTSLMSWFPLSDATQADAQCINQDISRYLSKYLSKEKRNDSTDSAYHPASWWGVDNATRREAKAERVRLQIGGISVETLRLAYDAGRVALSTWSDKVFTFTNPIFVGFGGQVGFCEPGSDLSALSYFVRWLDSHGFEYCLEQGV